VDTISKIETVEKSLAETVIPELKIDSTEKNVDEVQPADSIIEKVDSTESKVDVNSEAEVKKNVVVFTEPTKPNKVVYPKPSDPTPEALKKDYSDYPFGITEEMIDMKNHTIQRIVVVDSMEINVYKRVKHSWGGDFTFKNDLSISQRIWLDELEKYRLKFDKK